MIEKLEDALSEVFNEVQVAIAIDKIKDFLLTKFIQKEDVIESYVKLTPVKDVALFVAYYNKEKKLTKSSLILGRIENEN